MVDLKFYNTTIYKVIGDALQPFRELTWNGGYYMNMMVDYMFTHHMNLNIPEDRLDQHPGHPG